jgi:hypothetical protein
VLFADGTLLEGEMPLVGSPPISVQSCFTKGFLSISAVCRTSKVGSMSTRRHGRDSRLCRQ